MNEFAESPGGLLYRVYGLEGITKTQDAAITAQALTIAHHDEALNGREGLVPQVAVNTRQIQTLTERVTELTAVVKWMVTSMVAFAFTVAATGVGVALTLH